MIVHVIAREVGEAAGADPHAVQPVLVEPMRRRLERQMGDAIVAISSSSRCSAIGSGVVSEP